MEPTRHGAEAMLKEAEGIQHTVRTRITREHVPFYVWGLAMLVLAPVADFGDDSGAGAIYMWLGLAVVLPVVVALLVNDLRQYRRVRVKQRSSNWLIAALVVWTFATTQVLPGLLDDTTRFAHTLGGLLAAGPPLLWAERLRRSA